MMEKNTNGMRELHLGMSSVINMAHYARVENNIVQEVIVADKEFIATWPGEWIKTSYNTRRGKHTLGGTPLRKNYAAAGYIWDEKRDAFYDPQPHPTWTFNEEMCIWEDPRETLR